MIPKNMGVNWTDRREQSVIFGFLDFKANWSGMQWSTDIHDRRKWAPVPPIVAKLKDSLAREFGLSSDWFFQQILPTPSQEVFLGGYLDWDSSIWPYGYPDDPPRFGRLRRPGSGKPINRSGVLLNAGSYFSHNWLRRRLHARERVVPAGRLGRIDATYDVKQQ